MKRCPKGKRRVGRSCKRRSRRGLETAAIVGATGLTALLLPLGMAYVGFKVLTGLSRVTG